MLEIINCNSQIVKVFMTFKQDIENCKNLEKIEIQRIKSILSEQKKDIYYLIVVHASKSCFKNKDYIKKIGFSWHKDFKQWRRFTNNLGEYEIVRQWCIARNIRISIDLPESRQ